ncbi:uncharacterized protein JCM15063_001845 [Sporobolomyces koalae]|uniref:uncharacterized protein n=1 Tax=Sporobolomyces koalae TaxID=500713 RepID=UPI00316DC9CB
MGFSTRRSSSSNTEKGSKIMNKDDEGFVSTGPDDVEQNAVPGVPPEVDGVFGEQTAEGPNYRSVGWLSTSILLMKSQIGLGVLSIPSTFATLGLAPGIIILVVIAALTTYTDYFIGKFKLHHPTVYSVADCGFIMFGPIGREIFGAAYWLLMTLIVGSAIVGLSTALNAISVHGTCTAVFVAVMAVAIYPFASLRTLGGIKWLGWVGLVSILSAILTVTIAVGVGERPSLAPQEGPWSKGIVIWGTPDFAEAMTAISNLVLAFAGTASFLPIAAEMRNQRDYKRSVLLCQGFVTAFYLAIGVAVYLKAGQYVASPALGSAGKLLKRISYGLAIPGLLASGCIYCHLPAKYIFVRFLRGSRHLTANTATHWITWLSCTFVCVAFAYIIASAVPVFGGLVGLVGALFGTFFSLQAVAMMWFYDYWKDRKDPKKNNLGFKLLVALNSFIIVAGFFLMIAGTYGSIVSIRNDYRDNNSGAWSCKDNSGSV